MADDPDIRFDDTEYDPAANPPKSAKAWLNLLEESRTAFKDYNDHCDKIEDRYANLMRLSSKARDKEFQMFWANMEVLKPSSYSHPPQPVVVTKFKDRRPIPMAAAEFLERCCVVAFDLTRINDLMLLVRDDLALTDRGVGWVRYEGKKGKGYYATERVCIDFKRRLDFLHSLNQNWREVTWVAAASYLTRSEARKRFRKTSGDEYQQAEYQADHDAKEIGGADGRERAKFWEIWDLNSRRVIWVADGCENILDEDDAHIEFQNFFPCPKPAYGTVQPGSLVPVPSVLQYEDQLEEINLLTSRIHALSDALEAKGFYPARTSEIADAVQSAIAHNTPSRVLVPISNWAAFGGTKEIIVWLPIDIIAQVITQCLALRRQVIQDIYEIVGLSDIMRGATDPNETLGAQQIKLQTGSVRVRDKQQELVRFARDLVELSSDVMTEKFDPVTMIEMSQTDLRTEKMLQDEMQQITDQQKQLQQLQSMANTPEGQQFLQQNPDALGQAKTMGEQLQTKLQKLQRTPAIEQVLTFLSDNRARAFVLDIETDSTIQIDEQSEKQARGEFLGMLGNLLPQLSAMVQQEPAAADFAGELLKFAVAPFRAGRSLDGAIDTLVEQMKQKAGTAAPPQDPQLQIEQMKDQTAQKKIQSDADLRQQEIAQKDKQHQETLANQVAIEKMRLAAKQGDRQADADQANLEAMQSREERQQTMLEGQQKLAQGQQKIQQDAAMAADRRNQQAQAAADRRAQNQFKMTQVAMKSPPGRVPL